MLSFSDVLIISKCLFLAFQHFRNKAKDRWPHLAVDGISEKSPPNLLSPMPTKLSSLCGFPCFIFTRCKTHGPNLCHRSLPGSLHLNHQRLQLHILGCCLQCCSQELRRNAHTCRLVSQPVWWGSPGRLISMLQHICISLKQTLFVSFLSDREDCSVGQLTF